MKKQISTLLIAIISFIFIPATLFGQLDYRPGFVVTTKNDTLRGFILYNGVNLYNICSFKRTLEDKATDYKPNDLAFFQFNEGKYFVTKTATVENENKQYFLEFLIKGRLNVYFMRMTRDFYFIEKEGQQMVELTQKEEIVTDENQTAYVKRNNYKGKLKAILADCPEVFKLIDQTELSHASLIGLAKEYHTKTCYDGVCVVFESKPKHKKFHYGIYSEISFQTIDLGIVISSDKRKPLSIGFRGEFENVVEWDENLSIVGDLNFTHFSTYYFKELLSEVDLKANILKIPLTFNYNLLKGKFRPYAGLGITNLWVLSQNKNFKQQPLYGEYQQTMPFYSYGVIVKAGFKIPVGTNHAIYCEGSYEYTENPAGNSMLQMKNKSLNVLAGFSF